MLCSWKDTGKYVLNWDTLNVVILELDNFGKCVNHIAHYVTTLLVSTFDYHIVHVHMYMCFVVWFVTKIFSFLSYWKNQYFYKGTWGQVLRLTWVDSYHSWSIELLRVLSEIVFCGLTTPFILASTYFGILGTIFVMLTTICLDKDLWLVFNTRNANVYVCNKIHACMYNK